MREAALTASAGLLAATAFLLLWFPVVPPSRRTADGLVARQRTARGVGPSGRPVLIAVAVLGGWALAMSAARMLGGSFLAPLPALVVVAVAVLWLVRVRAQRRWRESQQLAATVAEAIGVLAADLSVGRSPPLALAALVQEALDDPSGDIARRQFALLLRPVAETARLGGSVPEALRDVGSVDGCAALGRVAAAWQVAETSGAPVVPVLSRVAAAVRLHADQVRDVRAELAGPRASARLLAALPVVGLLMGTGLGARPLHILLSTGYGQVAFAAGVALEVCGLAWTDRIARIAERS